MKERFYPLIPSLQRNLLGITSFKEREKNSPLVVVTDFEGPLVLGDTAAEVMSRRVKPGFAGDIDYGNILYNETYDWYTNHTLGKRNGSAKHDIRLSRSQEGTDITFAIAPLIATGVNMDFINGVAMEYRKTPGAEALLYFLKKNDATIVAVTTAWQEPHELIGEELDLDRVIGTPFPIDETVQILKETGAWHGEIKTTQAFLEESFDLIDALVTAEEGEREETRAALHRRIEGFYLNELGISFSQRERVKRGPAKTVLGQVIEEIGVVGDRAKAATALMIFNQNASKSTVGIAVGDGNNDCIMLEKSKYSIGLNGPEAAQSAKMGVVTDNVGILIPAYEVLMENPDIPVNEWIDESRRRIGSSAYVHEGGSNVPKEALGLHKRMKKKLRGEVLP